MPERVGCIEDRALPGRVRGGLPCLPAHLPTYLWAACSRHDDGCHIHGHAHRLAPHAPQAAAVAPTRHGAPGPPRWQHRRQARLAGDQAFQPVQDALLGLAGQGALRGKGLRLGEGQRGWKAGARFQVKGLRVFKGFGGFWGGFRVFRGFLGFLG